MDFKKNLLNEYEAAGKLISAVHPTLPLKIWNYSKVTQYERNWDHVTLLCRGLVTDLDGEKIVSRGFPKFFNIEEAMHVQTNKFTVFPKMDGQYIGVFRFGDEIVVNSRGSFTSHYAEKAKELLFGKYDSVLEHIEPNKTYVFELIGYERIVVSYEKEDLVFLGSFENKKEEVFSTYFCGDIPKADAIDCQDYSTLKTLNEKNKEGYIVYFSNGHRCKIKFEDYIYLHGIMTNLSTKAVWRLLKDGQDFEVFLEGVPDEYYDKVKLFKVALIFQFRLIEWHCEKIVKELKQRCTTRKEMAEYLKQLNNPYNKIIFLMLDEKLYSHIIWAEIEPKLETF